MTHEVIDAARYHLSRSALGIISYTEFHNDDGVIAYQLERVGCNYVCMMVQSVPGRMLVWWDAN